MNTLNKEQETLLSDEQLSMIKQVLTNLDHIVNARFDEIEGFRKEYGLCANVLEDFFYFLEDELDIIDVVYQRKMFEGWSYFSGRSSYPVLGEDVFYEYCQNKLSQYDLSTENGRLRIDLAKHCITYIKSYFNIDD